MSVVREKIGEVHRVRRKTFGEKFGEFCEELSNLLLWLGIGIFIIALVSSS